MYDPCSLYPIVHDLEDGPSSPQNASWCNGGWFDLQSLFVPSEDEPSDDAPRSICADPACTDSPRNRVDSVDSAASDSFVEHSYAPVIPERFQDAYVLTRQVRKRGIVLGRGSTEN